MGNLRSAVDELQAVDVRGLPDGVLCDDIAEITRQVNRLEAARLARLEVLDRRGAVASAHGSTQAWLRAATRVAPGIAARDVHLARELADALPATRSALEDGDVSIGHAHLIAGLRSKIVPEAMAAAEPHVVAYARQCSTTELRNAVAHIVHSYAPERFARDEATAFEQRRLHAATTFDGNGVGEWQLHPLGQETVMTAIHAASKPTPEDRRSAAQRRADALVTIAELALRSGELPVTGGVKPHVSIHVRPDTVAGVPGAPGAELGSGAVVGTRTARRVTCDAEIARIVFGPQGEVLDSGRTTRTFTAAQVRAIVARDRHCIWYGCDAPANWSDVHHRVHWAAGGTTSVDNGVLLCGRHHDRIHYTDATVVKLPDGGYLAGPRRFLNGLCLQPRSTTIDQVIRQRAGP
ncbi:MAG TPA: DUF222 domain-containing protein [Mycobacteriales bacterium]|nr:DUF222 domain-containing protein [Mycobacteriales bacterium]